MTQCEKLLQHLKAGNTITSRQAYIDFGVTQLATRISELKEQGHNIDGPMVTVPTRNGPVKVKEYRLIEPGQSSLFPEEHQNGVMI